MSNKFRARFLRKYGDGDRDWEYKDILVNYSALAEGKGKNLKPPNVFRWKGESYLYVSDCITSYDQKGHPIIKYYVGNMLPIVDAGTMETKQINIDETDTTKLKLQVNFKVGWKETLINGLRIVAETFDITFTRGEMKSVIASSQKEAQKFDWMQILIGIMIGAGIAGMIILVIHGIYPTKV